MRSGRLLAGQLLTIDVVLFSTLWMPLTPFHVERSTSMYKRTPAGVVGERDNDGEYLGRGAFAKKGPMRLGSNV